MAQFKKLTQSEVYNELQNNARNIHAPYTFLNLTPHRSVSDYEYFKQRKSELYCMNRADINVLVVWIINAPKDLNPFLNFSSFKKTKKLPIHHRLP